MSNFRHNGYLIHYNHNHDALGRFTSGSGGISKSKYRSNYKKVRKQVRYGHKAINEQFYKGYKENRRITKQMKRDIKDSYKEGLINKDQYRSDRQRLRDEHYQSVQSLEASALKGHYAVKKMERSLKTTYLSEIKGQNSRAYKRAKARLDSRWETYGNTVIYRNPNGSYVISRYY